MRTGEAYSAVHIENSYASGEKKRPRGPRSTLTVEPTSNLHAILKRPNVDLKNQAVSYYLHYHLQTLHDATNISKGISDDFLPVWMTRVECPIIDLAISSMALAVFSKTQHHPPAAKEASMKYHRLLQIVQATISSLDKGNIEACLIAIFFMSRYEDIVHRPVHTKLKIPFTMTLRSFSHHDGASAIVKFWKDHLSYSQPATDVIKHTRRGMIRSALLRNLALPEWMLDGTTFGEHGLELQYDSIIVRIANVRRRLYVLLKENNDPQRASHEFTSSAEELNLESRDIDKALQDWAASFPGSWSYQQHTLSKLYPWPERDFYSPIVYSYSSPAYAAVWNQYFATRMLINSTRLNALKLSHPNLDDFAFDQRLESLSRIKIMANGLASSLPYCLGRFKVTDSHDSFSHQSLITLNTEENLKLYVPGLIVWPLSIASSLADVDVKQIMWFRSELARLGRTIGIGILECADGDGWIEL